MLDWNHREIFDNLLIELKNYETSGLGNCVVIHGDSVMTNILININDNVIQNNIGMASIRHALHV